MTQAGKLRLSSGSSRSAVMQQTVLAGQLVNVSAEENADK